MMLPRYITTFVVSACLTLGVTGCSEKKTNEPFDSDNEGLSITTTIASKQTEPNSVRGPAKVGITHTQIEWTDLLPDDDLEALENPPDYLTDIEDGSEDDQLMGQLRVETPTNNSASTRANTAEDRYQQALVSKNIRPEFNGRRVRIPGFIVPLEFDDHNTITTFFLVPFFGACIHMPPPPPNQIIYAEYEPGIKLETLYDPFWIKGTLSTTLVENDMATAAYSIMVSAIKPYMETNNQQWSEAETP